MDLLEWVQRTTAKIMRGLDHLCYEERLSLGCSAWRKEDSREILQPTFQYLKRACKNVGEGHFTRVCSNRTRSNGFKLKEGRFRLDIRPL